MPDPTPHVENTKVASGDRATPVITDLTKGGKADSRIWHTRNYFQKPQLFYVAFTLYAQFCVIFAQKLARFFGKIPFCSTFGGLLPEPYT